MKNSTKATLASLPFLIIALIALVIPRVRQWQADQVLAKLEAMPLKSSISVNGEDVHSTWHTFSVGSYGVTDIGNLRLAFEDLRFSGISSGGVVLATEGTMTGGGGSSGVGNCRFESEGIPGGTRCTFGGITFDLVDGKLNLGDKSIDATGPPSLVVIGVDRRICEVKPLRTEE
jgi:hypothetical protein